MFIHEFTHFVLSIFAGSLVVWKLKRWQYIIPALLIGMLVDVDHFLDYFLYKKSLSFDLSEFLVGEYFEKVGRIILLFHGYEYVIILFALSLFIWHKKKQAKVVGVIFALTLSLLFHLLFDTYSYNPKIQSYFFSVRAYHNFDIIKLGF